jgi:uncharacterized protein YjbJ (UPF0337 family)
VPARERFADKGDQLAGRGEEVVDEVGGHEDLEAEGEDQQAKGSGEGIVEKAKEIKPAQSVPSREDAEVGERGSRTGRDPRQLVQTVAVGNRLSKS